MRWVVTAEQVRNAFDYNPETGTLTRRGPKISNQNTDGFAGFTRKDGYRVVGIAGHQHYAHRLIWILMTGAEPVGVIDHKDMNPSNNKWSNLREVSQSHNQQNQGRPQKSNKSGFLGVSRYRGKWRAAIELKGKHVHLGTHNTAAAAHEAYLQAKRQIHGGCTI